MKDAIEQEFEMQLQDELNRLKKAIDYIEGAKKEYDESKELNNFTKNKLAEILSNNTQLKENLNQDIADLNDRISLIHDENMKGRESSYILLSNEIQKLERNFLIISEAIKNINLQNDFTKNKFDNAVEIFNNEVKSITKQNEDFKNDKKFLSQKIDLDFLQIDNQFKNLKSQIEGIDFNQAIEKESNVLRNLIYSHDFTNSKQFTEVSKQNNSLAKGQKRLKIITYLTLIMSLVSMLFALGIKYKFHF